MNKSNQYCDEISRILNNYKGYLNQQAKASLLDNHKSAEYLFKQLLNLIYNWELKHTEERYSTNTSGIDLFSIKDSGYSVQITAQNTAHDKKVTDTIADYDKNWKNKYKKLKILFIQTEADNLKKFNTADKLIEILSFKELLIEIRKFDDLFRVKKVLDFLRQELGTELGIERLLKGFKPFEEKKKGNTIEPLSNVEAFKNGLLYYTPHEEKLINDLSQLFYSNDKKALIEGPPCSGKTSLLFGLNSELDKKLIKAFYIDLEEWNTAYENELLYFAKIDSLLIIDNAHLDRYELAKRIYHICDEHKINSLFISRDNNTQKLLRSSLNNYRFDIKESFTLAFSKNEQTIERINGIIKNRVEYLKRVKPEKPWEIGNLQQVIKNTELNLLKTSILLIYWESSYPDRQLQDVLDKQCYEEFYNAHIHKKMDYQIVFKYASVYKFDCPFKLVNLTEPIQQQIDNGVFIETRKQDFFYIFPHTEYAHLLSDAIRHEKNILIESEVGQILDYIINAKPENIHILVEGVLAKKKLQHLDLILSNNNSSDFIFSHYSNRKDVIDIKLILYSLNEIKNELNNETAISFVEKLINLLEGFNLFIFEKSSEEVVNKVNEVADYFKIEKRASFKRTTVENRFRTKNFFELSELITKNIQNKPFITKIASSFKYSEWKAKFEQYNGNYSKKIEGVVNLSKSPITRQLSFDLYELLDVERIYKNLEDLSIDIFGKAINNLSSFYFLDGKKKPKELLELFRKNKKFNSQAKHGLSKYSIGLSHINQVDNKFIQEQFPGEETIINLFEGASANDLAQRIPLFIKCFPSHNDFFISIIEQKLLDTNFYNQTNNNLQGYTQLAHIIKKLKFPISNEKQIVLKEKISENIKLESTLTEITQAISVLKEKKNVKLIQQFISPERISFELVNEQIKFTDLETILTQNTAEKTTVDIYTKLDTKAVRMSVLRNDTSFEQSTKVLMQLSNREYNYDKNKSYSKKILSELFAHDKDDFIKKINSSNVYDLLSGYCRLYKIDSSLTENNLFELIKVKSKQNHKESTLSTASQSYRNFANLGSPAYKELSNKFIQNSYESLVTNSKGIDIGQISDGLNELTFEHSQFAERLLAELLPLIKTKAPIEKSRADFASRIIPQLIYAAGKNTYLINEINKLK